MYIAKIEELEVVRERGTLKGPYGKCEWDGGIARLGKSPCPGLCGDQS